MLKLGVVSMLGLTLLLGGCQNNLEEQNVDNNLQCEVEVTKDSTEEIVTIDSALEQYASVNNGVYSSGLKVLTITEETELTRSELDSDYMNKIYQFHVNNVFNEVGTFDDYEIRVKFVNKKTGHTLHTYSDLNIQAYRNSMEEINKKALEAVEITNDDSLVNTDPLSDAGLTLTNFNKFERGMSMEEVERLFGIGWELVSSVTDGDNKQTTYEWKENDKVVWVNFFNYKSTVATQRNLR